MRYLVRSFVVAGVIGIVAACTHGNYDGGYIGGPDAGADGAVVVLSRSVDPAKDEVLTTPDTVFELTFAKGTFTSPTTVTITQLAERTENGLIVPTYGVSAAAKPSLPVQVVFHGSNPNPNGNSSVLLVAESVAGGPFVPTPIVGTGTGGGGPNNTYWGLTKTLDTFSLTFRTILTRNNFNDVSASSCIAKCCQSNGNAGTQANGSLVDEISVGCPSAPDLGCFVGACPDPTAILARAKDLALNNPGVPVQCRPYALLGNPNCPGPACNNTYDGTCNNGTGPGGAVCCVTNSMGHCTGQNVGSACTGIAIRCDLDTKCPSGTKCCAFETDTYCTATCPNERTVCKVDGDCAGTNCQDAPTCPFRTCGPPPAACLSP